MRRDMGASRRRCGNAGTGPLLAHAAVAFVLLLLTAGTANAFDDPDLAAALAAATAAAAGEDNVATATVAREDKSGVLEEDAGSPDLDSVTLGVSSVNPQAGAVRPEHEGIARSNQGSEENDAQSSSLSSSNKGMISGDASVVTSRPSDESVEHSTNERVAFETANVVRADGNNHKMGEPHDRAGSESMRLKDETREDTLSAGQERKDLDGELLSDKGIQQIETTEGEGRGSGKKHEGGMTEEAGQSEPAGLPGAVEGDKGLTFHLESTTMMEDAVVDETEDSISESVAAAAAVVDTATSGMVRVIHYISESRDVVEDGKEETVTLKAADVAEVKRPLDNDSPAAKAAGSSVDDYQLNGEKAAKEEVVIDAKLVSVARISDSSVDSLALAGERNMAAGVVGDALQPARNAGQKHQQQPQSLTQTVLDHEGEGNKSKNDSEPLSSSDLDREHTNQATGDRAGDPGNFESKQQVLLHGNDPRSAATATDIDHIAAHASENARTVVEKPALDGSADPRSYTKNEERQEHQVPTAVPGVGSDGVSRRGWGGVRGTSRVGAEGGSKSASSPDDIAQRVREMEEEILRKLLAEEDAKSLLDIWVENAKEFVLTKTVPPTDAQCDFNWSRLRCEPKCVCGMRLRFGDYTPGRACRLLHPWEHSPQCEDTWDPSDEQAARRFVAAVGAALGGARRAYETRVAPPTDSECSFSLETRRCEPQDLCRLRARWGDLTLSSACRLTKNKDENSTAIPNKMRARPL